MLLMVALIIGWSAFVSELVFAGWSLEEKLYQLKAHLDKTTLNVFSMLPDQDCDMFDKAVSALKKRFRPADIEELRGLEFQQVGISIQQLDRKAFPSIIGKDFDCLLKGQFYEALTVKWQQKLGCPKPDEGFHCWLGPGFLRSMRNSSNNKHSPCS